jgi:3-deoxy-manno-octulosonate cytidylyltransferase (CMP-KDO synthetase)
MSALSSYIVIPARLESTRLPRKLLLSKTGKPLLQHTHEAASKAIRPMGVCVATDHQDIAREVTRFGGQYRMTDPDAASGTDRVAEVAREFEHIDIFVNVQGDEPEIEPQAIDQVIALLEADPSANVATLGTPIRDREILNDPNCVKVVCNDVGQAMYFSRSPIPFAREWDDSLLQSEPPLFLLHLGIYAYRRDFLLELTQCPPSRLEQVERLEQLRVLSLGARIAVGTIDRATPGIDTIEDYRAFVSRAA